MQRITGGYNDAHRYQGEELSEAKKQTMCHERECMAQRFGTIGRYSPEKADLEYRGPRQAPNQFERSHQRPPTRAYRNRTWETYAPVEKKMIIGAERC